MSVSAYVVSVPKKSETEIINFSTDWKSCKEKLRQFEQRFESEIPIFEPYERTLSKILEEENWSNLRNLYCGNYYLLLTKTQCEIIIQHVHLKLIKMLFEDFSVENREKSEEYTFIYWSFRESLEFLKKYPDETIVILIEY